MEMKLTMTVHGITTLGARQPTCIQLPTSIAKTQQKAKATVRPMTEEKALAKTENG
jgi:hypothetical protein